MFSDPNFTIDTTSESFLAAHPMGRKKGMKVRMRAKGGGVRAGTLQKRRGGLVKD
jgi:hypothetical protein